MTALAKASTWSPQTGIAPKWIDDYRLIIGGNILLAEIRGCQGSYYPHVLVQCTKDVSVPHFHMIAGSPFVTLDEAQAAVLERLGATGVGDDSAPPFIVEYKNHRGEVATRHIRPLSLRYGSTKWHPEPQWLLRALDLDKKNAEREFALKDFGPAAGAGDGWHPVEEAPEDGSEVLAGFQGQFKWVYFVALAHPKTHGGVQAHNYAKPTHWRPLPAPLASKGGER